MEKEKRKFAQEKILEKAVILKKLLLSIVSEKAALESLNESGAFDSKLAPVFFSLAAHALRFSVIVKLAKLFDGANGAFSIERFLQDCKDSKDNLKSLAPTYICVRPQTKNSTALDMPCGSPTNKSLGDIIVEDIKLTRKQGMSLTPQ